MPTLEWLDTLQEKALDKCTVRIERLEELGHELRKKPESSHLRTGIGVEPAQGQALKYSGLEPLF